MWSIDENPPPLPSSSSSSGSNLKSFVDLLLESSEEYQYQWPHSFEFRLRVYLTTDGDLTLISRVRNIDSKPFSFSFSYHTYLLASDIEYEYITLSWFIHLIKQAFSANNNTFNELCTAR
jgi:glucose-6-phosphate 1-epimerase